MLSQFRGSFEGNVGIGFVPKRAEIPENPAFINTFSSEEQEAWNCIDMAKHLNPKDGLAHAAAANWLHDRIEELKERVIHTKPHKIVQNLDQKCSSNRQEVEHGNLFIILMRDHSLIDFIEMQLGSFNNTAWNTLSSPVSLLQQSFESFSLLVVLSFNYSFKIGLKCRTAAHCELNYHQGETNNRLSRLSKKFIHEREIL